MSVVIDFGKKISVSLISEVKKVKKCHSCDVFDFPVSRECLSDSANFKDIMLKLVERYPQIIKDYVVFTFSCGSGVLYKNLTIAKETLIDFDPNASFTEKEFSILSLLLDYLPGGFKSAYGNYEVSVISSYEDESDFILSLAFIPCSVLTVVNEVCNELNINLVNICPLGFGIFNAFDNFGNQVIMEAEESFVAINDKGIIVWPKPDKHRYEMNDIVSFFTEEGLRIFKITDGETRNEVLKTNKYSYLRNNLAVEHSLPVVAAGALGATLDFKGVDKKKIDFVGIVASDKKRTEKEGESENVAGSLRKFFEKFRKK